MSASLTSLAERFARLLGTPRDPTPLAPASPAVAPANVAPDAASTVPAPAAAPASPVQVIDFAARGCHLEVAVPPSQVVAAAQILDDEGFGMDAVTGVDWIAQEEMEVVYDFFHPTAGLRVAVRTRIPRTQPEVPTISEVFPGANWHERETHDFFGIRFLGHPDLSPLLLPEDADYHPLRKDFAA